MNIIPKNIMLFALLGIATTGLASADSQKESNEASAQEKAKSILGLSIALNGCARSGMRSASGRWHSSRPQRDFLLQLMELPSSMEEVIREYQVARVR